MKKLILFSFLVVLVLSGAGCLQLKNAANDGGIFKSLDRGDGWEQKVSLLSVGQPRSINSVNTSVLVFDPQDSNILYLGTRENGLFVSYNGGQSWQEVEKLPKAMINAVAIDPRAKHIIYVAIGNRIFKSVDCCREWQNIYLESAPGVEITTLAVDPVSSNNVLVGLSDGRLLRSANSGVSWRKAHEFDARLKQALINPNNPNIIYMVTAGKGLWRSADGGGSWQSLDEILKDYNGGREIDFMTLNPNLPDAFLTLSNYGLLRTDDGGQTWSDYKLLNQVGRPKIFAFTFNFKNPQEIYYATATTLFRSFDGGSNWQTKSLPSKRQPVILLTDPSASNILYLGTVKTKK